MAACNAERLIVVINSVLHSRNGGQNGVLSRYKNVRGGVLTNVMQLHYLWPMSPIQVTSTLTDRYQTTIPDTVRKALGLTKRDQLLYTVLPNGEIRVQKADTVNDDVALNAFLQLLEKDIMENPQNLRVITNEDFALMDKLTEGVELPDINEPLLDEDED